MVFAAFLSADVVHITGDIQYCAILIRRRRSLLTVLDLTSVRRLSGWRRQVLIWVWYRIPCRRAGRITTISRATLEQLLELRPGLNAKCSVVFCPVGQEFLDSATPHELGDPPVVLLVGTDVNKNLERTVKALDSLEVELRIVGRLNDDQRSILEQSGLTYQNEWGLDDDELVRAYVNSDVVVFASLYEGFGLPIIEAQAIGRPVVTSNVASMPEVAGAGAIFVDPYQPTEIADAVRVVLTSDGERHRLTEEGFANVQRFRPEIIAAQYAQLYRDARSKSSDRD
jgi:glycosyltransferase involved in cell wall biosynthesis